MISYCVNVIVVTLFFLNVILLWSHFIVVTGKFLSEWDVIVVTWDVTLIIWIFFWLWNGVLNELGGDVLSDTVETKKSISSGTNKSPPRGNKTCYFTIASCGWKEKTVCERRFEFFLLYYFIQHHLAGIRGVPWRHGEVTSQYYWRGDKPEF